MVFKISYGGSKVDPMIVCQCNAVSDRTILQLISDGVSTVAEITRRTGAGHCPPCRNEIQSMLAGRPCSPDACPCRP